MSNDTPAAIVGTAGIAGTFTTLVVGVLADQPQLYPVAGVTFVATLIAAASFDHYRHKREEATPEPEPTKPIEAWLLPPSWDIYALPASATHALLMTGSPREITSVITLGEPVNARGHVLVADIGRPLRHVVRATSIPGLGRAPKNPTKLNSAQYAELVRLARGELQEDAA